MKNLVKLTAFIAALILGILSSQAATQNPVTGGCPLSQWVNAVNVNNVTQGCAQMTVSDISGSGSLAGQIVASTGPNSPLSFVNPGIFIPGVTVPSVPGLTNGIVITPTTPGGIPTISAGGPGSDANTSLGLSSQGNGNIVLFAGNSTSTGVLQFANASSFIKATGLGACPAVPALNPPLGVSTVVTGYLVWSDIFGVKHSAVSC